MFTQFSCVYLLQCFASCGSFCMEYICNFNLCRQLCTFLCFQFNMSMRTSGKMSYLTYCISLDK